MTTGSGFINGLLRIRGEDILVVPQVFLTSGTYTPSPNLKSAIIEVQGGGGSGSGCASTGGLQGSVGGSGGGAAYIRVFATAAQIGTSNVTITVGTGGAASALGARGNNGVASSFGASVTAGGGRQAGPPSIGTGDIVSLGGGLQTTTTNSLGTTILDIGGQGGGATSFTAAAEWREIGIAGSSYLGLGAQGLGRSTSGGQLSSLTGTGYGSASRGTWNSASSSAQASVAGRDGIIIITEYIF